jgi:arabinofuranosyltransferase
LRRGSAILILSIVTLALVITGLIIFNYVPDDTFITLRYARNVLRGDGFVFNPGERVEGYTNFLWLLIIVFAGRIGFPLVMSARALSLIFSLGTLVLAARAARPDAWHDETRAAGGRADWDEMIMIFLAPMLIAASPPFAVWCTSGSEVPLFTFLLLAGYVLLRSGKRPGAAFLVFGLLGLVRPEGTLFYAVAFAYLLIRGPRRAAVALMGLGVVAVFYGPYIVWKWRYFHELIPNTFYAKRGPLGLMLANGARYLFGFFLRYGYLLIAGIVLLRTAAQPRERYALLLALAAVCALVVLVLGGDWMPHYRLLLPAIPLVMLTISQGVSAIAARDRRARLFAAMLVLLVMVPGAVNYNLFTTERITVRAFVLLGRRLKSILPPGTIIGCGSTGAIGYYTDMPVVDILGLTEPHIARHGRIVARQPGHLKSDGAYVLQRAPDLLLLGNIQIHRGEWDRSRMPLKVQERSIVEQSEFAERYEFVNVPLGRDFYLSCFKLRSYFLPIEPLPP